MSSSESNQKEKCKLKEDTKITKYYIETNNAIMNEIQELLTEQEIIKKKLIKENSEYYALELIFPKEITQKQLEIKFLLLLTSDYPNKEPELYCLTVFSHPHLCDGRNLLNDIIGGEWSKKRLPLETIINKIPKFIIKYNDCKNNLNIVGKYTLNQYYKISFLNKLPIYFHLITYDNKILTISDISLCLYDLDKKIGFCKLSFYVDIKDIIEVQSKPNKKIITINYKNILNNKNQKLDINTPSCDAINAILSEKIKIYKKSGILPDIDIIKIEKEIEEKEKEIKMDVSNLEKKLSLMSLYQTSVEYYSAINNPKFIEITHKIHKLFENSPSKNSTTEKEDKKEEGIKNNNKEEKNQIQINNKNNINSNNNITTESNKDNKVNIKEEKKELIETKIENNKNKIENDKKNEINEKIKSEDKKEITEKENQNNEKNQKDENVADGVDKEEKDIKEKKSTNDENKEQNNLKKNENKEEKEDKNNSIRLKIDEGDLGTLDVEDEEEEEEDD